MPARVCYRLINNFSIGAIRKIDALRLGILLISQFPLLKTLFITWSCHLILVLKCLIKIGLNPLYRGCADVTTDQFHPD